MNATENAAGQWRANGTPVALRVVEILGIEQGRQWGVCTVRVFGDVLRN
jgi:linoleate 10R-lipoxygenase